MGTKRRYHKYNNSVTVQREDKLSERQRDEHGQLVWRISVKPRITRNLSPTPKRACKGWTTLPRNRCFHSDVPHEKYVFEGKEYSLLDIDVTPLINPNVKKEGISCTYKKEDGYAPMAYFGHYALCFDLRKDISIAKRLFPSSSTA